MIKHKQLESQTLNSALQHLKAALPVKVINIRREIRRSPERPWDGELILKSKSNRTHYLFEIKNNLRPQTIGHLLVQAKLSRHLGKAKGFLLFTDFVNPSLGQQLKDLGINFVDAAGNLFLTWEPGIYLYIQGKKPTVLPKEKPTRLFQPSGLTLLFGLLTDPEAVNRPFRRLAETNGIALGTVGWIMRDLRENGYLEPVSQKQLRMVRKKELLEQWVKGYATRLRPKVLRGTFQDIQKDLDVVLEEFQAYAQKRQLRWGLTGGFGADELVHHYRGEELSLYVKTWSLDTQVAMEWIPLENGHITVLNPFSPLVFGTIRQPAHHPVVHPLLIYAELLYKGSDRDLETARLVYKDYLESSFAKD